VFECIGVCAPLLCCTLPYCLAVCLLWPTTFVCVLMCWLAGAGAFFCFFGAPFPWIFGGSAQGLCGLQCAWLCVCVCCGCWGHMSTTSHMALHFVLMVCTVAVSLHSTGCLLGVGDTLTQTLGHSVMFHTAICKVFISQLRLCHWAQVMVKNKESMCHTSCVIVIGVLLC